VHQVYVGPNFSSANTHIGDTEPEWPRQMAELKFGPTYATRH